MKANELRIGNWGNYTFKQGKVIRIDEKNCEILTDTVIIKLSYEDFEPIPLTEEILMKCGFKEKDYVFVLNGFHLENRATDVFSKGINKEDFGCWGGDSYLRELTYLHQLQNLYFALTGQELEIDL